jgi:hypothetical protein
MRPTEYSIGRLPDQIAGKGDERLCFRKGMLATPQKRGPWPISTSLSWPKGHWQLAIFCRNWSGHPRSNCATFILRHSASKIEWQRLVAQAQKQRFTLPIRETLCYVHDKLQAPVPAEVLAELEKAPTSQTERLQYKAVAQAPGVLGSLPQRWFLYLRYARGMDTRRLQPRLAGFPNYLKGVWGLDHLWQVPLRAMARGERRIRGAFTDSK